jgi:hypothetical protein
MGSTRVSKTSQPVENEWDTAIRDAERELAVVEERRARLKRAIRLFELNKRDGIPWPRDEEPRDGERRDGETTDAARVDE